MSKNIVILMDGTSNGITSQRTNILRLYGCLRKSDDQLVYYDPGVGTIGPQGVWSRKRQQISEIWGMATGLGVDANVKEAYRFLVENYDSGKTDDAERDRIYIFGFSRGAYTARMLAGFIYTIGLIEPRNLNLLDYAYRAYKRIGEGNEENPFEEVRLYERILATDRPPVRLLGLFDTVASVIEPGPGITPRLKSHAWTSKNPGVESVRHAVAIDERRRMFGAMLWPEGRDYHQNPFAADQAIPQDAKEVWFTGTHSDIGGGHAEAEAGLAKISLLWMIEETKAMGLEYVTQTVNRLVRGQHDGRSYVEPDAFAEVHESMTAGWRVLEYIPFPKKDGSLAGLTMSKGKHREIPAAARIHASVLARAGSEEDLPPQIPTDYRIEGDTGDWTPVG